MSPMVFLVEPGEMAGRATGATITVRGSAGRHGARLARIAVPRSGSVCLVVGPEGGISSKEISTFVAAGALVARMGDSVLRTSTAGVVAASVVMARSGRWD